MPCSTLELRVKNVECKLRWQRRWSAALLTMGLIAFCASLIPPRLDVLRGRRLEIVEKGGAVTGAFGIGAAAAIQGSQSKADMLCWSLQHLESGARASSNVLGHDGKGAGFLTLAAGETSWLSLAAMATGAGADLGMKDRREIWLMTNEGESSLYFGIPLGFEGRTVLSLSHQSGNPVIQASGKNGTAFEFR
jgi:hypothetical protein